MPKFRSIAEFRMRHLQEFKQLFLQVLQICKHNGMASLGHVALDGTKIKANASKHKAMSYGRMKKEEERLIKEIETLVREAERLDQEEDKQYGKKRRENTIPQELLRREERLKKIREAKQAIEQETKEKEHSKDDHNCDPPSRQRYLPIKPNGTSLIRNQRSCRKTRLLSKVIMLRQL